MAEVCRPDVALLIPFCNHAAYIATLLQQAASQSIPFSEIICYNDGGSDGSTKVAQELGVRVIELETNHRQAYARNRLLEAARSKYIHFHDVDDPLNPRF